MSTTVAITGSSGLVGTALAAALRDAGHRVRPLVRRAPRGPDEIQWTPSARLLDERRLAGVDVIVNLAGETIGRRWTTRRRRAIRESRVRGTETIAGAILRSSRPITLINSSAIGYYGDRGDEILDETSTNGRGFLAAVCRDWEAAARTAAAAGSRIVMMRSGVVLSPGGGALPRMLRPFRWGVGGRIGSGHQWLSWIDLEDMVRGIQFLIDRADIAGPVNMVAPNPVTNREFTSVVADVLKKPALLPVPAFALRMMFGEMANATILGSQRVAACVLERAGFEFRRQTLRDSLTSLPPGDRPAITRR